MNNIAIRTEGLSRDYGNFRALDKVDLAIENSRVVALLGPNGAGKTTFLRLLMGLLEPTEGKAWVLEADSRGLPEKISARIGYMGDADEPPHWSTIKQLTKLQAGASRGFDHEFAKRFMTKRGLSVKSAYGSLRLDPSARRDLYDEVRDHVTDIDATAIVATHIISDIERIADDVAIINHGRIVTYAALEDLREQVREIQLAEGSRMPEFSNGIEILGSKTAAGARLVWVRCLDEALRKFKDISGEKVVIRSVGLETFYLAMTEHSENVNIEVREK